MANRVTACFKYTLVVAAAGAMLINVLTWYSTAAQSAPCDWFNYSGVDQCYTPHGVAEAESQLTNPPIDPASIAWSATHLKLPLVIVFKRAVRRIGLWILAQAHTRH